MATALLGPRRGSKREPRRVMIAEGQVVRWNLDGTAACTGGSRGGLGVGDREDKRRNGGHDGFREKMEGIL